jgi:hypothetical protein
MYGFAAAFSVPVSELRIAQPTVSALDAVDGSSTGKAICKLAVFLEITE